ncbi:MAG: UDP-N-acetylmuramyl-tripeptide synthetase, partial [Candidatus Limnocylindrales bacterium]
DTAAIIETTSHGLAMDRVAAIGYDIAVMTNVTHEHLELHGTFDAYRAAKMSLFERLEQSAGNPPKPLVGWPRVGIVNVDDPSAELFIAATRAAGANVVTYGHASDATVRLLEVRDDTGGQIVTYRLSGIERSMPLQLQGRFNATNALAVVAIGSALQLDPESIEAGLARVAGVPGRMERVVAGQPFEVIVDYAHSPASLATVLDELAPRASARGGGLIAVFGSAGERDVEKRPVMGRIAAERCRLVVLTDEDPRGEDRSAVIAEIAAGAQAAGRTDPATVLQIPDRAAAIREAFRRSQPGDIVLLAGKGHETTILYADHAQPWDEAAEARAALAELGFAG